jgi:transcription-repair coupling factor (superfamily II helicase)
LAVFQPYLISAVFKRLHLPLICILPDYKTAQQYYNDVSAVLGEEQVLQFSSSETAPYEWASPSCAATSQRMQALYHLRQGSPRVIITTAREIMEKIMPVPDFEDYSLTLKVGQTIDINELQAFLQESGYLKVSKVDYEGEFSVRGGIIDIYSAAASDPVRLDFFDDEIESISYFDLVEQKSYQTIAETVILPQREFILTEERLADFARKIDDYQNPFNKDGFSDKKNELLEKLNNIRYINGIENYRFLFNPDAANLLDYLEQGYLIIPDLNAVATTTKDFYQEIIVNYEHKRDAGDIIVAPDQAFWGPDTALDHCQQKSTITFSPFKENAEFPFNVQDVKNYRGLIEDLITEFSQGVNEGWRYVLLCIKQEHAERLAAILADLKPNLIESTYQAEAPGVYITVSEYTTGFQLPGLKIAVYTESEIFGKKRVMRRTRSRKRAAKQGREIDSFLDLTEGDYVVHVDHGIALYRGIKRIKTAGVEKDFLYLEYRDQDKLYVPISQIGMVQRYIGQYGKVVQLDSLRGKSWERVKKRVKKKTRDLAEELLKVHAQRQAQAGIPFNKDDKLMYEFEAAFPYFETPDQLEAIKQIKGDLEKPQIMDRLVCGDVGFGKTEVSMRAVFKVVTSGYQVAVLAPTTVLVQQHYHSFQERFANFPLKIEVLSRFRTAAETKKINQKLKNGEIDIVIGTHKLLNKNIEYKALGLLVIDEEQRFGVAHKEKIKKLKKNIDVLTMTATPIPRTLHMGLSGLKDVSVINTPPENRQPILTHVVEMDSEIIKDACERELQREGQIYFLHNRVETIEQMAAYLKQFLPDCRMQIAHGQLEKHELEEIMEDFYHHKFDMLVCTTIIESGLDIPNVNTIFINRADTFGLSQLYQLRGRVGRSQRQAYAYLMYQPNRPLSELASKRLYTIDEYTQLGSGFKIALRDLEIRGAGNLLGSEQHGEMVAVGFEMYCRLLEETVQELQGEAVEMPPQDPLIDLPISAYIDEDYITDKRLLVEVYMKVNRCRDLEELAYERGVVEDRFGRIPDSLRNVFAIIELKILAKKARVVNVAFREKEIVLTFKNMTQDVLARLMRKINTSPHELILNPAKPDELFVRSSQELYERLEYIKDFLTSLVV